MERKAGFKECPKCGLRNKPAATQCDFCGQNLGAPDDWQHHIKDLESLNKMDLRKPLDDRTSKRIESTIIRKDAPSTRNVEIKEAGNIGKVLRELDELPVRHRSQDSKDDGPRQTPIQEKLGIKEVGSASLVEKNDEEPPPVSDGTTIADMMKAQTEEAGATESPAETRTPEEVPSTETVVKEAEEPEKEDVIKPLPAPEVIPEADQRPSADPEPKQTEKPEEEIISVPVTESPEEVVQASEVTLEVVQPIQDEVTMTEPPGGEEQQITVSSNDSRETIKLKLVEVEMPKEKLAPMALMPLHASWNMKAVVALALGSVAYLVVFLLTAFGLLGAAAGLGAGAVSSFIIIYGAAVIYPSLRERKDDEVYICPKCHEKVSERSDGCPACGAEFED